jgi:hypothetical protein
MRQLAIILLKVYKYAVSPLLPPSCRFVPTCSEYACQAIERFGVWRGTWLGLRRLLHCHPFYPGGYDPVPDRPLSIVRGQLLKTTPTGLKITNSFENRPKTQDSRPKTQDPLFSWFVACSGTWVIPWKNK